MFIVKLITLFIVSSVLVKSYLVLAKRQGLLDIPNHRSSHIEPTPRGGGLVFILLYLVMLVVSLLLKKIHFQLFLYYFIPVLFIALISFLDDNINLSAKWRFSVQFFSVIFAMLILQPHLLNFVVVQLTSTPLIWFIAVCFSLWSINLFNFMDGTDGIAAIQAIFVLGGQAFIVMEISVSHFMADILCFLCVAISGFLIWNWPKAKVFMGDIGSASLGLIVVLTAFWLQKYYDISLLLSLMLYGVFLFDASLTLIRRILHKEKWYEAHKSHAYQRLCQAGYSHLQLLFGVIILNCIFVVLFLISFYWPHLLLTLLLLEFAILCIIYLIVEKLKPMYPKTC